MRVTRLKVPGLQGEATYAGVCLPERAISTRRSLSFMSSGFEFRLPTEAMVGSTENAIEMAVEPFARS